MEERFEKLMEGLKAFEFENKPKEPRLYVSKETWHNLTPQQQQQQHDQFDVTVAAHYYASGPVDLDTPIELAPVPREVKA